LEAALTHRSYSAETGQPERAESQRLEFLGDAVLGAVSAEWLVAHRPEWREGTLTKVRSRLTNAAALARVARRLGLGDFLRLGRAKSRAAGGRSVRCWPTRWRRCWARCGSTAGVDPVRRVFVDGFADEIAAAVEAGGDDNPKGDCRSGCSRSGRKVRGMS
jgi:ribonuclease III